MGYYTYDLLEPGHDLNAALDELTSTFAPLYTESFIKEKAPKKGNPAFDMNVNAFAQMWFSKVMRIFMAYDGKGEPCGYLLGMMFRPLTHQASIFQIEDWYAKGEDARHISTELFDYARKACKFMGIDELWVSHGKDEWYPALLHEWKPDGETVITRYIKE